MKNIKTLDKKSKQLYRQFKIKGEPTVADLKIILKKLGYVIQPYTNEHIKTFGKRIPPAYTIESNDNKIVLYNDALSEKDLTIAFSHELAHSILCHSYRHNSHEDTSTYQDYEADIFVYRFLNYKKIKRRFATSIISIVVSLVVSAISAYYAGYCTGYNVGYDSGHDIADGAINNSIIFSATNDENVVITATGTKYHKPHCRYVKYKTNTIEITENEAVKSHKEPCDVCFQNREE